MDINTVEYIDESPTAKYTSEYTKPLAVCADTDIPLNQINVGEFKYFHWVKGKIGIYKLTDTDLVNLQKQKMMPALLGPPAWWVQKDNPAIADLSEFMTHSVHEGVFVFWQWSPIFGCELFHFPERRKEDKDLPGPRFLGEDWNGGFVDLCTMRAFDYYGRLVKVDEGFKPERTFPSYFMVKPHYSISNNTVHLKCKL